MLVTLLLLVNAFHYALYLRIYLCYLSLLSILTRTLNAQLPELILVLLRLIWKLGD
ncbi:hypothetical protein BDZ89DRAFT_433044 [Hymenopellis radicata]|nr:hypothetical protein BDZ89DRAFT_433044 [Hymenopellis radicata]